ncbi:MAG: DUF58 domain-containing protein [Anaerolineales bacterium]|jgi:uncharacterized protein (DUF58 family)|nr:DUF58 domain-containing protein [Anaerolineales bacterium]
MIGPYLLLLIPLALVAALMSDDFALTLIYLLVGAFSLGSWWSRRALQQIEARRELDSHAFLGQTIKISLKVRNNGLIPAAWVALYESRPLALGGIKPFQRVTGFGPRQESSFEYTLEARKRGYYPVGPLILSSGDLFGLSERLEKQIPPQFITVYPKIVALARVGIPSRSPQGTLRHHQPLFEDPTRVFGKRAYVAGDSLRRVDWKATAQTGRMQVKLFEPSISLETLIFLNLNAEDYNFHGRIDSTELGIVIAASLASWVIERRQSAGLRINGRDPLAADGRPQPLPPRKGKSHLMRMLEVLARVETTSESPLAPLIQRERLLQPWGTTLLVITGQVQQDLLNELHQARRSGQNALLILAGSVSHVREIQQRAAFFGVASVSIAKESDLDIWRR